MVLSIILFSVSFFLLSYADTRVGSLSVQFIFNSLRLFSRVLDIIPHADSFGIYISSCVMIVTSSSSCGGFFSSSTLIPFSIQPLISVVPRHSEIFVKSHCHDTLFLPCTCIFRLFFRWGNTDRVSLDYVAIAISSWDYRTRGPAVC